MNNMKTVVKSVPVKPVTIVENQIEEQEAKYVKLGYALSIGHAAFDYIQASAGYKLFITPIGVRLEILTLDRTFIIPFGNIAYIEI